LNTKKNIARKGYIRTLEAIIVLSFIIALSIYVSLMIRSSTQTSIGVSDYSSTCFNNYILYLEMTGLIQKSIYSENYDRLYSLLSQSECVSDIGIRIIYFENESIKIVLYSKPSTCIECSFIYIYIPPAENNTGLGYIVEIIYGG